MIAWTDLEKIVSVIQAEAEKMNRDPEIARKAAWTAIHMIHREKEIKINFKK